MSKKDTGNNKESNETLILGVGNLLLKDEGIGVHVIRELQKINLPAGVKVMDGGTGGLSLFSDITSFKNVIIVDAMNHSNTPGKITKFTPKNIKQADVSKKHSFHQDSISEVLKLAKSLGKCPQVVIFGIQPKEINWGLEPTPELKAIVPSAVKKILTEANQINRESNPA